MLDMVLAPFRFTCCEAVAPPCLASALWAAWIGVGRRRRLGKQKSPPVTVGRTRQ
jgi:hypothetical protein